MSTPPAVVPRKSSGVRLRIPPGEQPLPGGLPTESGKENGTRGKTPVTTPVNADREVEILNHCFDDVERFMLRLQQAAEAQGILNQRKKKSNRKSKKEKTGDLLTMKAMPPPEEEFVALFQKIKYSLCLLGRLKSSISQPNAPELLHHIFIPLSLMVKTTGGPALASSVASPAMTSGVVSLLQEHLNTEEKELWTSLGSNWTSSGSELGVVVPPYSPTFMDGWQPQAFDSNGQRLEDPIQLQHKQDAARKGGKTRLQGEAGAESHGEGTEAVDGNGLPQEGKRVYCCYDFVARNSSELSVLQGETLEVLECSKRWWKCQNRFDQIGFVPYNILEPLSALNNPEQDNKVVRRESKKTAFIPHTKRFSYVPSNPEASSPTATKPSVRAQSMVLPSTIISGVKDDDRVLIMNDELLQRLAARKDTSAPLNYDSPSAEVVAWLTAKRFRQTTIESLGILNGAQLFSLNKEEICTVIPEDGAKVYSEIMAQKAILEDVHKASEVDAATEKQKM